MAKSRPPPDTRLGSLVNEWDYFWYLLKKRPVLWILLLILGCAALWYHFKGVEEIKVENTTLRNTAVETAREITNKNTQIQLLETQLAPFRAVAIDKFPGRDVGDALALLGTQINKMQKDLDEARSSIQTFSVKLTMEFSGSWKENKEPGAVPLLMMGGQGGNEGTIDLKMNDGRILNTTFGSLTNEEWKHVDGDTYRYSCQLTASAGDPIMGLSKSDLSKITAMSFVLPGVSGETATQPIMSIHRVHVMVFVNGIRYGNAALTDSPRDFEFKQGKGSSTSLRWVGERAISTTN